MSLGVMFSKILVNFFASDKEKPRSIRLLIPYWYCKKNYLYGRSFTAGESLPGAVLVV